MIEIFDSYKNMRYRSEVKEELEYMLNHLGEMADYHRAQGYISALKWVLWDLNDVEGEVKDETI